MKSDLDKIIELNEQDVAASKAQDMSTLLTLWDDDGVALPPGGEPIIGIEALRTWLAGQGEPDYEVTEYVHDFAERQVLGDWAFEWGTYQSAAKPIGGEAPFKAAGKLLRILRRQPDGAWKVARAIWNVDPQQDAEE
jgi:ketosteroid isomerase-like protein